MGACGPQTFSPALLKGFGATDWPHPRVLSALSIVVRAVTDLVGWVALAFWSRQSLDAEVRFLRRQLALYVERALQPGRIDGATRVSLALLSRLFAWRSAGVVVRPQTLIRWHRVGFRLLRGGNVLGIGREKARSDATVLR